MGTEKEPHTGLCKRSSISPHPSFFISSSSLLISRFYQRKSRRTALLPSDGSTTIFSGNQRCRVDRRARSFAAFLDVLVLARLMVVSFWTSLRSELSAR